MSLITLHRNYEYKYNVIITAGGLFLCIALVTMLSGPLLIPTSNGLSMNDIAACRVKIIGFEQIGYYSSPEQFRTAE